MAKTEKQIAASAEATKAAQDKVAKDEADAAKVAKDAEIKASVAAEKAANEKADAVAKKAAVVKEDENEKARVRQDMRSNKIEKGFPTPSERDRLYAWMQGKGIVAPGAGYDDADFTDLLNVLDENFARAVEAEVYREGPAPTKNPRVVA